MTSTYHYHVPFNKNLWRVAGFFALVALAGAIIPPFELHARRYTISNNILLIGGLVIAALFLVAALLLKLKSNASKNNPHQLELTQDYFQFPIGKDALVQAKYTDIASPKNIGNKMNGDILEVKARNKSFKSFYIQGSGFSSEQEFKNFETKLLKNMSVDKA